MSSSLTLDEFTECGSHQHGHFMLSSGLHSGDYLQCALFLADPRHEVARSFDVPFLFTERADGDMVLRRGFAVTTNQRVVVVEDVVTTGKSTREVIDLLERADAEVIALASIVNRSGIANPFDPLPYRALLEARFPTWQPDDCPLCADGVPIAKPGSRPVTRS